MRRRFAAVLAVGHRLSSKTGTNVQNGGQPREGRDEIQQPQKTTKGQFFKHFLRGGSILNVSNEDDLFFTRDNGLLQTRSRFSLLELSLDDSIASLRSPADIFTTYERTENVYYLQIFFSFGVIGMTTSQPKLYSLEINLLGNKNLCLYCKYSSFCCTQLKFMNYCYLSAFEILIFPFILKSNVQVCVNQR